MTEDWQARALAAEDALYTPDQERVAKWITDLTGIGGGDDPIGFLFASHEAVRAQRDEAQSAVTAWQSAVAGLEAHLLDRTAMHDPADPERYLRILRAEVREIDRTSKQIVAARWADYARLQARVERAEAAADMIAAEREAWKARAGRPEPSPSKTDHAELVERVARLIEPGSWRVMDAELARVNRIPNAGYDPDNFKHRGSMAKAAEIIGLIQALSRPADKGWRPTHRHVRSGGYYQVIERAKDITNEHGEAGVDVVIYRGVGGHTWVRRASEFDDGRFACCRGRRPVIRVPVTTLAEYDALEDEEVIAGYRSGRDGEPEPGGNRSLSFWHGWRNGMADAGHMPIDDAMSVLVAAVVRRQRASTASPAIQSDRVHEDPNPLPAKDPS